MAERRMFTKKITDGDMFTAMPPTTQCLYFHLCMGADDDGFSNNVRIAMFNAHATTDDYNTLVQKRFIIPFDSGVIVIKHWRMHNYIAKDRYHETKYLEEKAQLQEKENGVYSLDTKCIQDVYKMYPEVRLGKDSIVKDRKGKDREGNTHIGVVYFPDDEKLNDTFVEYIKMRKTIKKPLTENGIKRKLTKLDKLAGTDNDLACKIIEQAIDHCWQDFYPLKDEKASNKQTSQLDAIMNA